MSAFEFTRPPVAAELHVDFPAIEAHIQWRRDAVERACVPAMRQIVGCVEHSLPTNGAVITLADAFVTALERTFRFGYARAQEEISRMRGIRAAHAFSHTMPARTIDEARRLIDSRANQTAEAVGEAARNREGRPEPPLELARRALHNHVIEAVGETLNNGRAAGARNYGRTTNPDSPLALADGGGPPMFAMRSEQLDKRMCAACGMLHGEIVEVESAAYYDHMPPSGCYGGGRCRGIYVFGDGPGDVRGPDREPSGPVPLPERPPSVRIPEDFQQQPAPQLMAMTIPELERLHQLLVKAGLGEQARQVAEALERKRQRR